MTADETPPVSTGTLAKEEVNRVIRAHAADVRRCYEAQLASKPGLRGRIVYQLVIGSDGAVSSSGLRETSMSHPEVESCVGRASCRWTFPRPDPSGPVVVTYPFSFRQ